MLLDRSYGSFVRGVLKSSLDDVDAMFTDPGKRTTLIAAFESHGINEAARGAIQAGNLPEFVLARENELRCHEDTFLKKFDLRIGDSIDPSDDEVDVDED